MGGLYGDGIVALQGAFSREWGQRLREDMDVLFEEGRARQGALVERGPHRYYAEVHPERLRGFAELASHPWVVAVCTAVLGPEYRMVEVGFDVPCPGAEAQPWHRDFPSPPATLRGRRLDSLAFNLSGVDVTDEMGPLEIAPGTQWDPPEDFADGMFPPQSLYPRYQARAQRRYARMGDVSARSALTIHRGTPNRSGQRRPVLVLGVDAPDAKNAARHDLQVTERYLATLPELVRRHLGGRVVRELEPIVQAHQIEGLRNGG
jgi:ectoine hydroxylase-related dioxygenase (phytanoyl-CoA dioxygenase family)